MRLQMLSPQADTVSAQSQLFYNCPPPRFPGAFQGGGGGGGGWRTSETNEYIGDGFDQQRLI